MFRRLWCFLVGHDEKYIQGFCSRCKRFIVPIKLISGVDYGADSSYVVTMAVFPDGRMVVVDASEFK